MVAIFGPSHPLVSSFLSSSTCYQTSLVKPEKSCDLYKLIDYLKDYQDQHHNQNLLIKCMPLVSFIYVIFKSCMLVIGWLRMHWL